MPRFTRMEFPGLYREFLDSGYLESLDGVRHLDAYEEGREDGLSNYWSVLEARERGEDVTDLVLLKLLPHSTTTANRERGAWVHIAPAIQGDVKRWFENVGWTKPEDWSAIADAILRFLQRCDDDPGQLVGACADFARLPYVKGFQTGMLTPILNALRTDDYLLVNLKSRQTINYFSGESYGLKLIEYPDINATGRRLIGELAGEMDQPGAPELSDADRFDVFSHWLVAERKFHFPDKRYWKVAPGEGAWQWEECKEKGFVGVGWNDTGDVSGMSRAEFDAVRDRLMEEHGWKKGGVTQVWTFAHDVQEGDEIVANRGVGEVLGFGTVVGPYEFVPDAPYAHQFPVDWHDTVPRRVSELGWRSALIEIKPEKYEELRNSPPVDGAPPKLDGGAVREGSPFSARTFELLSGLHENPTKTYYRDNREDIRNHVEEPFRGLVREVAERLPAPITGLMETRKGIFAKILKNDYGRGGAYDYYWGAFYSKGGRRISDAQLSTIIKRDQLEFGFYIGDYASDQRDRFRANCRRYKEQIVALLEPSVGGEGFAYGDDEGSTMASGGRSLSGWLESIDETRIDASTIVPRDRVLELSEEDLVHTAVRTFELLFPLVLLATSDDPIPEIMEYLGEGPGGPEPEPAYGMEQLSHDTGIGEEKLRRWVRAIDRKGQAIFYGPPGTGKTFIAQHLAKHLIGGEDGFWDIVQFHPSYSYEDFVQGVRPESRNGNLSYPVVPGRFKEFCREASKRSGPCVLIVDEINRANLSRVFGELMYLLEYRDAEVPLAGGGTFRIPINVRLVGTMNTADRSIALVDHALRRRFAFLELYPDYELLRRFHSGTDFPVDNLIDGLKRLNRRIDDRHYEVGITFFLHKDLREHLEDIWRMEIEPYLEEYFFDRPAVVDEYRWERVEHTLNP